MLKPHRTINSESLGRIQTIILLIHPDYSNLQPTVKISVKINSGHSSDIQQYSKTNTNQNYFSFKIMVFIFDLNLKLVE